MEISRTLLPYSAWKQVPEVMQLSKLYPDALLWATVGEDHGWGSNHRELPKSWNIKFQVDHGQNKMRCNGPSRI